MNIKSSFLNVNKKNSIIYFTFPSFEKYSFVSHAFSSRIGGISTEIYSSLNLGFNRGDDNKNVYENYKILCSVIGVNQNDLVFGQLTHDNNIKIATSDDKGKGIIYDIDYSCIDGLITSEPNIPLTMTYADCVPIFFLDPVNKIIAIAHSGWRGTVKKIGEKMINVMIKNYNCNLKDILIGIGPSIGACCFKTDKDVYNDFLTMDCLPNDKWFTITNNKYYIDMWKIIKNMFIKIGILESNITVTDLCTKCHNDIFFSHRATNGQRGSLAGIIQLNY